LDYSFNEKSTPDHGSPMSRVSSYWHAVILMQALRMVCQDFDDTAIGDTATGTLDHHPLELLL
jgi:hypothetical protein